MHGSDQQSILMLAYQRKAAQLKSGDKAGASCGGGSLRSNGKPPAETA